jgi:maltose/maltodextrin transport system permease protein
MGGTELKVFVNVFIWTLIWSFASVFGMVALGTALAIPLNNKNFKGKNFYRTLLIVPWAIPAFITVLMWQGILNSDMGAVNLILMKFFNLPKVSWLSDPNWARFSVLIVNIWLGFPFMMSICLGALQSIPNELYEAASVDGAPPAKQFYAITIPLLRNAMLPVLISSFAFNFNQFGSIYLLTGGGPTMPGSPNAGATDILVTYSYKLAFNLFRFGLASAYAVFIFVIIAALSSINFKVTGAFEDR